MLLLKKHLVALVRQGKKRQTIRFWSRPVVRPGQISYTPGLGKMKILSVEVVDGYAALTDADAIADGFANRAELLAELERTYGPPPAGKTLYRVCFAWPVEEVTAAPLAEKSARFPPAGLAVDKQITGERPGRRPGNTKPLSPGRTAAPRPAAAAPFRGAAASNPEKAPVAESAAAKPLSMAPRQRERLLGHVLAKNPFGGR